ncbi:6-phospho-3-hexuloisomerase [Liquorilactobacillus oeni]|uniref:6-phospho-3-hexuloisomerase n=1 Tax=Liquorilactobacillus oeni DSM 19972 TaxID=1423777 RepID=A0A0R1ML88_9LACO|nr:6-phospho-3-hexuloisomerase [Liquorilactobacillus oeni]KRL06098.1 6-phospho-3-hexuloisomerase [Liquorilactobacillus oeni DSM 19972]
MYTIDAARSVVLKEIDKQTVDSNQVERLLTELMHATTIFITGHGRSGLVVAMFGNRLLQLGLKVHIVGEITCPPINKGDLLLIVSGSGNSPSLLEAARTALTADADMVLVTTAEKSSLVDLVQTAVLIKTDTKRTAHKQSHQPMGALFEQSCLILFEACVLCLQERLNRSETFMEAHHANIE